MALKKITLIFMDILLRWVGLKMWELEFAQISAYFRWDNLGILQISPTPEIATFLEPYSSSDLIYWVECLI